LNEIKNHKMIIYSEDMQNEKKDPEFMKVTDALKEGVISSEWHAYWLTLEHKWFIKLGADPEKFRIRQHLKKEKSHYAEDTWDLEYNFPFGWKELEGLANRTDFDLNQHIKHSKKDLSLFDEETKKKVIPHVIAEPSLGLERSFLVFMFDAYTDDKERGNIVLKLHPKIAPIKIGIFPLVNKLKEDAKSLYEELKVEFDCTYDYAGSIGRRYARADETGVPYCITFDFDSKQDKAVTVRDRDSTKQERIKIKDLNEYFRKKLS